MSKYHSTDALSSMGDAEFEQAQRDAEDRRLYEQDMAELAAELADPWGDPEYVAWCDRMAAEWERQNEAEAA